MWQMDQALDIGKYTKLQFKQLNIFKLKRPPVTDNFRCHLQNISELQLTGMMEDQAQAYMPLFKVTFLDQKSESSVISCSKSCFFQL